MGAFVQSLHRCNIMKFTFLFFITVLFATTYAASIQEKKKNDFLLYGGWASDGIDDDELEAWKYTVNWY